MYTILYILLMMTSEVVFDFKVPNICIAINLFNNKNLQLILKIEEAKKKKLCMK